MKIAVYSDLHLEFARFEPPELDVDVVILAGDIMVPGHAAMVWAKERPAFRDKLLLHVAGNHEFYGEELRAERARMVEEARRAGIHHLHMDRLIVGDVRFLGCTLWTDFQLGIVDSGGCRVDPALAMAECGRYLVDYRAISLLEERDHRAVAVRALRPADTLRMHLEEREWLQRALADSFDGPTVVVTHHAPHRNSLAERYADDWISTGFVSDLPSSFFEIPELWVHGHTHTRFDYQVRDCRVVCNPRGYRRPHGAFEADFDPALVIEVPAQRIEQAVRARRRQEPGLT